MNLMGVGAPEIAVILLVAFIVLGPARSISMAKTAGKILGDLRRTFNEVTSAVSLEERDQNAPPKDSQPQTYSDLAPRRSDAFPSSKEDPPSKTGDE